MSPRGAGERRRIWWQAALPVTLRGSYAYLASVISAAHLLHSLEDSLHPAVAALLPLLDPTHGSPHALPARLAAAEAALPPEALEALQAGKADPKGLKLQQSLALAALDARFRHDHYLRVDHIAHTHLRSSALATAGETAPAAAGGQGNDLRDEGSRAAGALHEEANAEPGTDIQTHDEQANTDEGDEERTNDDDASGGRGTCSVTPRDEANEATAVNEESAANEPHRDDRRGGSPACHGEQPRNDGEANAPGAPQPLRRSARRTPHAQAPSEARIRPRAEPARASDPRSGDEFHLRMPAEQQVRSRQDE
ncbi:unnamed protein product [Closterium sp. Naga37s-1]|nr:unnamed protein product [Closterium sp. Naga37s-1]